MSSNLAQLNDLLDSIGREAQTETDVLILRRLIEGLIRSLRQSQGAMAQASLAMKYRLQRSDDDLAT